MRLKKILFYLPRVIGAIILLQTLYFKFTGHPSSVHIFTTMEMEPWGRIGFGIIELIAAILLLIPRLSWLGAVVSLAMMGGAIFFHLGKLGINVMEDGGKLFALAVVTFLASAIVIYQERISIFKIFGIK